MISVEEHIRYKQPPDRRLLKPEYIFTILKSRRSSLYLPTDANTGSYKSEGQISGTDSSRQQFPRSRDKTTDTYDSSLESKGATRQAALAAPVAAPSKRAPIAGTRLSSADDKRIKSKRSRENDSGRQTGHESGALSDSSSASDRLSDLERAKREYKSSSSSSEYRSDSERRVRPRESRRELARREINRRRHRSPVSVVSSSHSSLTSAASSVSSSGLSSDHVVSRRERVAARSSTRRRRYTYRGDGYDSDGFDKNGFDRQGYDRDGYNRRGYDRQGYDFEGYNREGFDRHGFDRDGYDRDGYDRHNYHRSERRRSRPAKHDREHRHTHSRSSLKPRRQSDSLEPPPRPRSRPEQPTSRASPIINKRLVVDGGSRMSPLSRHVPEDLLQSSHIKNTWGDEPLPPAPHNRMVPPPISGAQGRIPGPPPVHSHHLPVPSSAPPVMDADQKIESLLAAKKEKVAAFESMRQQAQEIDAEILARRAMMPKPAAKIRQEGKFKGRKPKR